MLPAENIRLHATHKEFESTLSKYRGIAMASTAKKDLEQWHSEVVHE